MNEISYCAKFKYFKANSWGVLGKCNLFGFLNKSENKRLGVDLNYTGFNPKCPLSDKQKKTLKDNIKV